MSKLAISDVERLEQNPVWKDFVQTIKERIALHQRDFEELDVRDTQTFAKLQGQVFEDRWLLMLPELLKADILQDIEEEKNNVRN